MDEEDDSYKKGSINKIGKIFLAESYVSSIKTGPVLVALEESQ